MTSKIEESPNKRTSVVSAKKRKVAIRPNSQKSSAAKTPYPPVKSTLDSAGRVLIPSSFRKALKLQPGDGVRLVLVNDTLHIRSLDDAINDVQALVEKHTKKTRKRATKELISKRRTNAKKE